MKLEILIYLEQHFIYTTVYVNSKIINKQHKINKY